MNSNADNHAARLASNYQCAWYELVDLCAEAQNIANLDAVITSIAQASGKSAKSIATKVNAILHLLFNNSVESVKNLGEEACLKRYAESRKAKFPEKETWTLKLPESAKTALLMAFDRVGALIGSRSRETQSMLVSAILDDMSDEEIKHAAGMGK